MKVEEISKIISEHYPVNSDAFQDVMLYLLETEPDDMHQLYRSINLEMNKSREKRQRARSFENTLYKRFEEIEKSLKLQQTIICKIQK